MTDTNPTPRDEDSAEESVSDILNYVYGRALRALDRDRDYVRAGMLVAVSDFDRIFEAHPDLSKIDLRTARTLLDMCYNMAAFAAAQISILEVEHPDIYHVRPSFTDDAPSTVVTDVAALLQESNALLTSIHSQIAKFIQLDERKDDGAEAL